MTCIAVIIIFFSGCCCLTTYPNDSLHFDYEYNITTNYEDDEMLTNQIIFCEEGTLSGYCSLVNVSYLCLNGTLIYSPIDCGCPKGKALSKDKLNCIEKYQHTEEGRLYWYNLRGEEDYITIETSPELKDYLVSLPRTYICINDVCPTDEEITLSFIDEEESVGRLNEIVKKIENKTDDKDDQIRIAVSFVQSIPYDYELLENEDYQALRYPYEVIYDNKGVCGEKSKLLAYIIRELGYGVVLFEYGPENHMSVGIKCPKKYGYKGMEYCFIESTLPSIITDSSGEYEGAGKLWSEPIIIYVSDGYSFESVSEEYYDVEEWKRINEIGNASGGFLTQEDYEKWQSLVQKYRMNIVD